jgi:hypothetical protein
MIFAIAAMKDQIKAMGSLRNLIMVRSGSRRGVEAQATVLYKRIQASVKAKFSG